MIDFWFTRNIQQLDSLSPRVIAKLRLSTLCLQSRAFRGAPHLGSRSFHNDNMWKISNTVFSYMFIDLYFAFELKTQLLLVFHIELCSCGSRNKLLFELITHSTGLSKNMYCANLFVCQSITSPQFTMSQSSSFQVQIGSQGLQRRTTIGGVQALGKLPGHYSMAASARGVGSYASHRPGVTRMDTPSTASAIRYIERDNECA